MPGDSAFPSGTPSFQLLINYSHISHPILPSHLDMRDLFSSLNSAARVIVAASKSAYRSLRFLRGCPTGSRSTRPSAGIRLREEAYPQIRASLSGAPCHDVLSINVYLAGFLSAHSFSVNRLKVHPSNPYHTTHPFHALQLLHPSICASRSRLVERRPRGWSSLA